MIRLENERAQVSWLEGERLVHGREGCGIVLETPACVGQTEAARRIGLTGGDDPLERLPRRAGIAAAQRLDAGPGECARVDR